MPDSQGASVRLGTYESVLNDRAEDPMIVLGCDVTFIDYEIVNGQLKTSQPSRHSSRVDGREVSEASFRVKVRDNPHDEYTQMQSKVTDPRIDNFTLSIRTSQDADDVDLKVPRLFSDSDFVQDWTTIEVNPWSAAKKSAYLADVSSGLTPPSLSDRQFVFGASIKRSIDSISQSEEYPVLLSHFFPWRYMSKYSVGERARQEALAFAERMLVRIPSSPALSRLASGYATSRNLNRAVDAELIGRLSDLAIENGGSQLEGVSTMTEIASWLQAQPFSVRRAQNFRNGAIQILVEWLLATDERVDSEQQGLELLRANPVVELSDLVVRRLSTLFSSGIRYLGPLRAEPLAVQGFAPSSEPDDVGPHGEYAAAVYDANKESTVSWWDPEGETIRRDPLSVAVDAWVRYLGIAHDVRTREFGTAGVSWQICDSPNGQERPLGAVGVGVSQVLPILVAGIMAPLNSLLLFEQPELHLHPRAQARLGDFFLGLEKTGLQCIVETHSDCLVNQLRYRIVSGKAKLRDDVRIYFASKNEYGESKFENIDISEHGAIVNWPEGFFDESLIQSEDIARQAVLKRMRDEQ